MLQNSKNIPLTDRFGSTFFVATLFHAVVIFGITFADHPSSNSDVVSTFKITLTTEFNPQKQIKKSPRTTQLTTQKPDAAVNFIENQSGEIFTVDAYRMTTSPNPENNELPSSTYTQDSILAAYLDNWRRKVEAIGRKNLPERGLPTPINPTLEVTVGSKGQLVTVVVRRSSGSRAVDQAALNILRLAEPFDPLPESILQEYGTLSFAYEWRFFPNAK